MQTSRVTIPAAERLLGCYFPVLDYGFVSLVDYMGGDESVAQAARVSYGSGTKKVSKDTGLIRYLMRHWHTTPSEMVELKFHMKMPIFVARQLVRHRTANINEYSGRYSLMPMQFYTPQNEEFCKQASNNKQGRAEPVDNIIYHNAVSAMENARNAGQANYEWLLENDVAKELARIDLPLSMYTEWYWKIDLHNLFHFLRLRCDSHAQWEIQQFGNVIAGMVKKLAPASFDAWVDYRLESVNMSRQEFDIIRDIMNMNEETATLVHSRVQSSSELSSREKREFEAKLFGEKHDVPLFDLDVSKSKDAEYFVKQAAFAVPTFKKVKKE